MTLLQDVRQSLRGFAANKAFTATAVMSLAMGIAADTAIFSVFEPTLLRPLPFAASEQLVSITRRNERTGRRSRLSYPHYLDLREGAASFEAIEAYQGRTVAITDGADRAERVTGQRVSAGLLPMLGVEPQIGRGPTPEDERIGAPATVLLSDRLWRRRYGGAPTVLGTVAYLNSEPHTIIGVMPPGFAYPGASDIWTPLGVVLGADPLETARVSTIGQLSAGSEPNRVATELADLGARTAPASSADGDSWVVESRPLGETFVGSEERLVTAAMMGAVTFLLLLACANVASLLLVRAGSREREFAVRAALGAGRARVIRQLLVESLLLAGLAGLLAVPLAAWGLRAFGDAIPPSDPFPFFVTFRLSTTALAYTFLVALLTGIAFGLAPAFMASQVRPIEALKADGHGSGAAPKRVRMLSVLVVAEIALAMTLLVGSSHFARTFVALDNAELGYDPSRIMTMRFYLPGSEYDGVDARVRTVLDIQDRLEAVPGVDFATISDLIPLEDDGGSTARVEVDGAAAGGREQSMFFAGVLGDWLKTFDVDVIAGRDFDAAELRRGTPVAVINQTMAGDFWPESSALGRRFRFVSDSTRQWYSVIGVIPDMRTVKLDEDERTPPTAFVPIQVLDTRDFGVMLRTAVPPASVTNAARDAVAGGDPDVPTYKVWPMDRVKWLSFWMFGLWAATFSAFGVIALLLAAIGVYGVISYSVGARRHEIGVRVALGASGGGVVRLVVARGARLAALGLGIGLVLSALMSRIVQSLLIGVSTSDPLTYLAALAFLGAVALIASLIPALSAARLDAIVTMRR